MSGWPDGTWQANPWVKQAILCGFRRTNLVEMPGPGFPMFDKTAYPARHFGLEDGVRLVPGGSSVRRGAHIAKGVVIMPPAYVNVGAFVRQIFKDELEAEREDEALRLGTQSKTPMPEAPPEDSTLNKDRSGEHAQRQRPCLREPVRLNVPLAGS